MASNSKSTEIKRSQKTKKGGQGRKKSLARKGTTRSEAEIFGNVLPR